MGFSTKKSVRFNPQTIGPTTGRYRPNQTPVAKRVGFYEPNYDELNNSKDNSYVERTNVDRQKKTYQKTPHLLHDIRPYSDADYFVKVLLKNQNIDHFQMKNEWNRFNADDKIRIIREILKNSSNLYDGLKHLFSFGLTFDEVEYIVTERSGNSNMVAFVLNQLSRNFSFHVLEQCWKRFRIIYPFTLYGYANNPHYVLDAVASFDRENVKIILRNLNVQVCPDEFLNSNTWKFEEMNIRRSRRGLRTLSYDVLSNFLNDTLLMIRGKFDDKLWKNAKKEKLKDEFVKIAVDAHPNILKNFNQKRIRSLVEEAKDSREGTMPRNALHS